MRGPATFLFLLILSFLGYQAVVHPWHSVLDEKPARETRGGGEAQPALPAEGARESAPLNDYQADSYAQAKPADREPPLDLSISTDKSSYLSGEPILLTVALHNHSARAITLVHPDFWGVSEIRVVDGEGHTVSAEGSKSERQAVAEVLTLQPGETRTHQYDNLTVWTCCHRYSFHLRHPGRYWLTVSITNPPIKATPPAGWRPDWTGTVSSRPLLIEVRKRS